MIYSYRIEQAIRAAAILHKDHVRKGAMPLPYVTHLFSVACIIASYTDDEDIIIAGLLHDTLEDTDYTPEELEEDFGAHVRTLVEAVTQPEAGSGTWKERHQAYIQGLKEAPSEALIVAAADKIHNMRSVIEIYYQHRARFLRDFGGTLDERIAVYQGISNILNTRSSGDIVQEFNHVFSEYKQFIYDTQALERSIKGSAVV